MTAQFRVMVELPGRSERHPEYPLLPGDIITRAEDGTWTKHAPGLGIGGFVLADDDLATLEPADDARWVIA